VSIPDVVVRYGEGCPNAFIHGKRIMLGMGDDVILTDFTKSLAIFAHEVGHWTNPKLRYRAQSGAVSEHLADVIGVCVQRAHLGADHWRVGSELFVDGVSCLRDMANPGTAFDDPVLGRDQQVGHMSQVLGVEDNRGGVHYYSGVLSKAFTLFAEEVGDAAALAVWQRVRRRVGEFIDFDGFARIACAEAKKDGLRPVCVVAFAAVGLVV
jgi:Zn-dependent metalloprotease